MTLRTTSASPKTDDGWKAAVRSRFSQRGSAARWSDMYRGDTDDPEEHFFRQRRDYTVRYVLENSTPESSILDLGCGSGPVTAALRRDGRRVVGCDYSMDMLRLAGARVASGGGAPGGFVQGDSERLPIATASVDVVVCLGVLSYVLDYRSVLGEIRRVLKPGGRLVVSTRNTWNPRVSDPLQVAREAVQWLRGGRRPVIGRFLSPHEVERHLGGAGFSVERFTGMGFGPLRLNRRPVLGARASIRLSDALDRAVARRGATAVYRWFADVNLWICTSPPLDAH